MENEKAKMSDGEPGKIFSAMIAVMRDVEAIGKNSKNSAQGFMFRGIDSIYNDMHAILAKHGIVTLPMAGIPTSEERATKSGGTLRFTILHMTYRFMAEDGSFVDCSTIGEAMDSGDKSVPKCQAIAHKYALLQTFLIPTEDMIDPDETTHEPLPKAQPRLGIDFNTTPCTVISVTKKNGTLENGDAWTAWKAELSDGRMPWVTDEIGAEILAESIANKVALTVKCEGEKLSVVSITGPEINWIK